MATTKDGTTASSCCIDLTHSFRAAVMTGRETCRPDSVSFQLCPARGLKPHPGQRRRRGGDERATRRATRRQHGGNTATPGR